MAAVRLHPVRRRAFHSAPVFSPVGGGTAGCSFPLVVSGALAAAFAQPRHDLRRRRREPGMVDILTRRQGAADRVPSVWLSQGFRPFFLAAGFWAVTALAIWILMLTERTALPSRFDPLAWHIHEMLFGFVMAAVAGFLLTAI